MCHISGTVFRQARPFPVEAVIRLSLPLVPADRGLVANFILGTVSRVVGVPGSPYAPPQTAREKWEFHSRMNERPAFALLSIAALRVIMGLRPRLDGQIYYLCRDGILTRIPSLHEHALAAYILDTFWPVGHPSHCSVLVVQNHPDIHVQREPGGPVIDPADLLRVGEQPIGEYEWAHVDEDKLLWHSLEPVTDEGAC